MNCPECKKIMHHMGIRNSEFHGWTWHKCECGYETTGSPIVPSLSERMGLI